MSIKTAIILAGGKGLRLKPHTNNIPKPLIEVSGKPLLEWIINWLIKNNVTKIVIGVAYKKEKIIEWIEKRSFNAEIIILLSPLKPSLPCQSRWRPENYLS